MHELRKFFKVGDHVKVVAGRYEGDTGMVVKMESSLAIVFSDLTMSEVGEGEKSEAQGCFELVGSAWHALQTPSSDQPHHCQSLTVPFNLLFHWPDPNSLPVPFLPFFCDTHFIMPCMYYCVSSMALVTSPTLPPPPLPTPPLPTPPLPLSS